MGLQPGLPGSRLPENDGPRRMRAQPAPAAWKAARREPAQPLLAEPAVEPVPAEHRLQGPAPVSDAGKEVWAWR